MNAFCVGCPDRGGETCPLTQPNQRTHEVLSAIIKIPLGVMALAGEAAYSGGPMKNHHFIGEQVKYLLEGGQSVSVCIEQHQSGENIPAAS